MGKEPCISGLDSMHMHSHVRFVTVRPVKCHVGNAIVSSADPVTRYFTAREERENTPWSMCWRYLMSIQQQACKCLTNIVDCVADVWSLITVKMLTLVVVHSVGATHAMSVSIRAIVNSCLRKKRSHTLNVLFVVNALINNACSVEITTALLHGWATQGALQRCTRRVSRV